MVLPCLSVGSCLATSIWAQPPEGSRPTQTTTAVTRNRVFSWLCYTDDGLAAGVRPSFGDVVPAKEEITRVPLYSGGTTHLAHCFAPLLFFQAVEIDMAVEVVAFVLDHAAF